MTGGGDTNGQPEARRTAGGRHGLDPEAEAARNLSAYLALAGAIVLHVMVGALLPLTTALGPRWMLAASVTAWVATAVLIWRWHRSRPIVTLFVPFALLGVWYLALQAGARYLGWVD